MKIHPIGTVSSSFLVALLLVVVVVRHDSLVSAFTAHRQWHSLVRQRLGRHSRSVLGLGFLSLNQFLPQPITTRRSKNESGVVDLDQNNTTTITPANESSANNDIPKPKSVVSSRVWRRNTLGFLSPRRETQTTSTIDERQWILLARMLHLLRFYESEFGLPPGDVHQVVARNVMAGLTRELYESGAPTWVVEPLLERVAHGFMGRRVQFSLMPRQALISYSTPNGSTEAMDLIPLEPSFNMHGLLR